MLFNSIDFAIFLPIVFLCYWFLAKGNLMRQNIVVVASSYVFYGWWDWRFLFLIFLSSVIDFSVGLAISRSDQTARRKRLLWLSLFVNLGFLMFFKYFNFFVDNFEAAFSFMGQPIELGALNIILPVGISFYTFQTLSYTIDVYRGSLKPTRDFVAFMAFVSFFPQLVAGPIERASRLLPQFYKPRTFEYSQAIDGLKQVLWGFFKKVVIADSCAQTANMIFNNYESYSGVTLIFGAVLFAFQIYGDFSGYSDIAIGTAKIFGVRLMKNFAFPYFSRDIAEFWRRWHISLSTWFRDYLYIPLGGSRGGTSMRIRNTFIIFLVSGFWHGANWTFIVWGLINAIYFLPLMLTNNNRNNMEIVAKGKLLPSIREVYSILLTFALTTLAWIFFRAENIGHATDYIYRIFTEFSLTIPELRPIIPMLMLMIFLVIEWLGREGAYAIEKIGRTWHKAGRWGFYYLLALAVLLFSGQQQAFIYFQF